MSNNRIVGNGDGLQVVPVQSVEIGSRRIGEEEMFVDMATGARYLRGPGGQPESIVMARTSPGGGNRLLAGNLPADMAQLSNVVVAGSLLQSWTANGIDYVATYSSGKVAAVTASDGWVQTYAWAGDVPTITVEQA